MAAERVHEPPEVDGEIAEIVDGVARVLIGDAEEEWFFPLNLLPDGVDVGGVVAFVFADGRYEPVRVVSAADGLSAIESRLSRPLNAIRSDQYEVRDLRRQLDEG